MGSDHEVVVAGMHLDVHDRGVAARDAGPSTLTAVERHEHAELGAGVSRFCALGSSSTMDMPAKPVRIDRHVLP
jgi:hypothetical protein